jgi:NADPH:quinone reductase-like Zn-dependent oxidoreductase
MTQVPRSGLRITSTVTREATLELALAEAPLSAPEGDEVLIRVEAAPINPSDLMVLLATVDPAQGRFGGSRERPRVTIPVPAAQMTTLAGRVGLPLGVGLEGAGTVIAAGEQACALLGKKVAVLSVSAGMFAQYRMVRAADCVVLPDDVTAEEGAALFVNPLTALAIVETVRIEGFRAFIHTAAASNLGQMLVKICREDGVPLVNVVRKQEQVELLRMLGARYICNSSLPSFRQDLIAAIRETGAMVAFDAVGGGTLASELLSAMETVAAERLPQYSLYGSHERKHVYQYGMLDRAPTQLMHEGYGLVWGVSSWAMPSILERVGPKRAAALRQRVVSQLKTTFASRYVRKISLPEVLTRDAMLGYARQATGEKYLITPQA